MFTNIFDTNTNHSICFKYRYSCVFKYCKGFSFQALSNVLTLFKAILSLSKQNKVFSSSMKLIQAKCCGFNHFKVFLIQNIKHQGFSNYPIGCQSEKNRATNM